MDYRERQQRFQAPTGERTYDTCYLIDPTRTQETSQVYALESGVFSSTADAIHAILDSAAGQEFTQNEMTQSC